MHVLRQPDAFEALLSHIYSAALDGALWPDALVAACDYLGAIGGMLVRNEVQHGRGWMVVGRLRDDLTQLYLARYVDNPYTRAAMGRPSGRAFRGNAFVDVPALRRTAFHADMLAPQGIAEQVILPYAPWHRGTTTGGVGFMLDARAAEAPDGDLHRRLARLTPHVLRAIDLASAAGNDGALVRGLGALIDASPSAAVLLDATGRLVRANARAEALLRRGDGLRVSGSAAGDAGRLRAARPADDRRLAAMVARAAAVAAGLLRTESGPEQALSTRVGRPSGLPDLAVLAVPLSAGTPPWVDHGAPHVALFVAHPDGVRGETGGAAASLLGTLFGLTRAEQRVAALVGAGLGVPETARRLSVSTETARTHLRRCLAKTGTRSQVGLARVLASLPAGDHA